MNKRCPAALEERPPAPQHNRCGQRELHPGRGRHADEMQAEHVGTHRQQQQGDAEHARDPQPPRKVDQLRVRRVIQRGRFRLQRHATDGAGAGHCLANLRMHRAGPHGASGGVGWSRWRIGLIALWISDELRLAPGAAEMDRIARMFDVVRRCCGIDRHPADRVFHGRSPCPGRRCCDSAIGLATTSSRWMVWANAFGFTGLLNCTQS